MQGQVTEIPEYTGNTKGRDWVAYSIMVGGQKYSAGFKKPVCNVGDIIDFNLSQNERGYMDATGISVVTAATATAQAAQPQAAEYAQVAAATPIPASQRDISIQVQSSRKDALTFLAAALSCGALPTVDKMPEESRYDFLVQLVSELTDEFYNKLQESVKSKTS